MNLMTTQTDNITLDMAKQHLYIQDIEDDKLIPIYIASSLAVVEDYIHDIVLERTYETTQTEIATLAAAGYKIQLNDKPKEILVTLQGHTYPLLSTEWRWNDKILTIDAPQHNLQIEKISAICGRGNNLAQITQARLLLIGDYYSYRNDNLETNIRELPTGIKMILGNCTGLSL